MASSDRSTNEKGSFLVLNPNQPSYRKHITIIGLGNEFLSDDGAGIRVVQELKKRLPADSIVFEELAVGGLQLLDYLLGTDECIIIDAVTSRSNPAGTLYRFIQAPDDRPIALSSSHQIDLGQVLGLARILGGALPQKLSVYGIEACDITTFHDGCTEQVAKAIPTLVNIICHDLHEDASRPPGCCGEWEIIQELVTT